MNLTHSDGRISALTATALVAALICVVSPWTLALGPIPLSFCTLIIYLAPYLVGWKRGSIAVAVYVLLGAVGVPVFSNFGAGLGKIMGPTGGYILGYLPLAVICGLFLHLFPNRRWMQLVGMVLGTAVLYLLGTAWFCVQSGQNWGPALALCVFPFLPGDCIKIAAALTVGPMLMRRLKQAGLREN